MPKDMRSWINQLEERGELLRLKKPADPRTEMGALLYQSREKAILFENLNGFPGWRSLGMAPANLRHAAIAFDASLDRLIPTVAELMERRLPCEMVQSGPVKESKKFGSEDIRVIPGVRIHSMDPSA